MKAVYTCPSCHPKSTWPCSLLKEPLHEWKCLGCGATGIDSEDIAEHLKVHRELAEEINIQILTPGSN